MVGARRTKTRPAVWLERCPNGRGGDSACHEDRRPHARSAPVPHPGREGGRRRAGSGSKRADETGSRVVGRRRWSGLVRHRVATLAQPASGLSWILTVTPVCSSPWACAWPARRWSRIRISTWSPCLRLRHHCLRWGQPTLTSPSAIRCSSRGQSSQTERHAVAFGLSVGPSRMNSSRPCDRR